MRITGGVLCGRRVEVPQGRGTAVGRPGRDARDRVRPIRPAMDRMRESVFACLPPLTGLSFLDLFSGSGIIALEAASRGAEYIEAVEADREKGRVLIENVSISPVRINCRFMSVELYAARAKRAFDVIFCDPPFPYKDKAGLVTSIAESPLAAGGSRLLLHHPAEETFAPDCFALLKLTDRRVYGRSVVDFFLKT